MRGRPHLALLKECRAPSQGQSKSARHQFGSKSAGHQFGAAPAQECQAPIRLCKRGEAGGQRFFVPCGDLVEKVLDWPGVNTAAALLQGASLKGHWIDRTQQHAARNRREDASDERFAVEETVLLSPPPCWAHLTPERYREQVAALVEEVETEAALARRRSGKRVLGAKAILAQSPQTRPEQLDRSPAPLVHAATKAARRIYELYAEFVSAFRTASGASGKETATPPFPPAVFHPPCPSSPADRKPGSLTALRPPEGHRGRFAAGPG
jgi:hypothetical protein